MTNFLTFLLASCLLFSCQSEGTDIVIEKTPHVQITIDASPQEADWQHAKKISSFINPWNKQAEPYTEVNLLWNGSNLYFNFQVKDKEVVLAEKFTHEHDVSQEDRVEFFFSPRLPLTDYYALELDPLGRTLDYKVGYYRKFDESWNVGKHLQLKGKLTPDGYCVEGAIDRQLLKELTSGHKTFYLGAYRAEFSKDKNGKIQYEWLCIKDPNLPEPDFHVEGTFVKVTLE